MATDREYKAIIEALIEDMTPKIRNAFLAAISDIVDNVILKDLIEKIELGDVVGAFRTLGFSDAAMRPLTAAIEQAFEAGGLGVAGTFPRIVNTGFGRAVFRFDVRNSRAEAWLRDHSSQLITRITDEARTNVMNILQNRMITGDNPRRTALDIVGRIGPTGKREGGVIGLTRQQERWVYNARRELMVLDENYFTRERRNKSFDRIVYRAIRDNTPLTRDQIDKLITSYKNGLLKYRGEVIARTESLQALNAAEYEATRQAQDMGATKAVRRHWDSAGDSRVRWSHKAMDAKYNKTGVGIDEPFVSPSGARMMFPGDTSLGAPGDEVIMCRCRVRLKVDWLSGVD